MDSTFSKKSFLESYLIKQKELGKRQREYKQILSTQFRNRKQTIFANTHQKAIDQLHGEKNELRAKIWVACGETHRNANRRNLSNIKCHVECQEHLGNEIHNLKTAITNIEREKNRINKQIYHLNRKTVPLSQHQIHVAAARKRMIILENQLEVGMRRECEFTADNAILRDEVIKILNHRTFFNDSYTKLVQKLNSDKKYLIDLIEYALGTFDNCIEVYEKMDFLHKKHKKECDARKVEMQGIIRKKASETEDAKFMDCKVKERKLDGIQPKEYRRREEFRKQHKKKISLYNKILNKILEYTSSHHVGSVINKFQEQESLYYSYFNYANEMSYHMTLLNNCVNRLYSDINNLKQKNRNVLQQQLEAITSLEKILKEKQGHNEKLVKKRDENDTRVENLLQGVEMIFDMCKADDSPLMVLLGDHDHVNLENMRRFLKILANRIYELTSTVYIAERRDDDKGFSEYVVKQIEKICEWPTELDDIVLTQQCPECAEGEAFNIDEGGDGGAKVLSIAEAKKKLFEKINQPEMQYRLHSISQCRLPRSRLLAAKRNV